MTLLVIDGFDNYSGATAVGTGWASGSVVTTSPGRFGDGRYATNPGTLVLPTNQTEIVLGVAIKNGNVADFKIVFWADGDDQIGIYCDRINSRVDVRYGGFLANHVYSNGGTFYTGAWNYLEMKVLFATGSAGSYAVRINGVAVPGLPDQTNFNTTAANKAYCNSISITSTAFQEGENYDDLYVLNTSGTKNNDFLGDVRVETLYPNGAGSSTQWTPQAVTSNWQAVDETPVNDDTDYVYDSTVGHKDLYTMTNLSTATGTVYGVQCDIRARKTDSGTRGIQSVFKSGATEADSTTFGTIPATYQFFRELREDKPGGTGWTISEVNAMELGVKVTV